jgi:hypothetical protein
LRERGAVDGHGIDKTRERRSFDHESAGKAKLVDARSRSCAAAAQSQDTALGALLFRGIWRPDIRGRRNMRAAKDEVQ